MDPPKHAVCELTLDFTNAKTEADLWAECKRVLCPKFDDFGANLDALVDILRGGFGLMTPFKLTILGRDSALASAPQRCGCPAPNAASARVPPPSARGLFNRVAFLTEQVRQ